MNVEIIQRIVYICLNLINIILHGLGYALLHVLYHNGQKTSQRLYLLNLSLAELLQNILRLIIHSIVLHRISRSVRTIGKIGYCILYITNTGVYYQCFTSVCLLTGDRLISMGQGYTTGLSLHRRLAVIKCTWVFNITVSLGVFFYTYFLRVENKFARKLDNILTIYVPTFLFVIFLLFAVFTYTYMFYKFLSSNRITQRNRRMAQSVFYTFRHSKFFISVIIISSFLFLMVIPGLVATCTIMRGHSPSKLLEVYLNVSVTLNDTTDGVVYVFLQPDVKRFFLEKFCDMCFQNKRDVLVINHRSSFREYSIAYPSRLNLRLSESRIYRPVSIVRFDDSKICGSYLDKPALTTFRSDTPIDKSVLGTLSDASIDEPSLTFISDVPADKPTLTTLRSDATIDKTTLTTFRCYIPIEKPSLTTCRSDATIDKTALTTFRSDKPKPSATTFRRDPSIDKPTLNTFRSDVPIENPTLTSCRSEEPRLSLTTFRSDLTTDQTTLTTFRNNVPIEKQTLTTFRNDAPKPSLTTFRSDASIDKPTLTTFRYERIRSSNYIDGETEKMCKPTISTKDTPDFPRTSSQDKNHFPITTFYCNKDNTIHSTNDSRAYDTKDQDLHVF